MMKNMILSLSLIFMFILSGCGEEKSQTPQADSKPTTEQLDLSNAKDGIYTADSSRDEKLGISQITLKIENHKIVGAEFVGYDLFGDAKGEDYGSLTGKDSADYKKAQIAVKANNEYAKQLVETQALDKVDAISGATVSYNQFVEVTKKAVKKASE